MLTAKTTTLDRQLSRQQLPKFRAICQKMALRLKAIAALEIVMAVVVVTSTVTAAARLTFALLLTQCPSNAMLMLKILTLDVVILVLPLWLPMSLCPLLPRYALYLKSMYNMYSMVGS